MNEKVEIPEERVSPSMGINFSIGAFANNILNGLVFASITFFYIEKLGANPTLIAIAWMIFLIWNTINDPIISYFIDNTRTKIGRRIPYIRYGSIFYGLAFIFCWFPIAQPGDDIGLFFNFFIVLFLLDTMYSIIGCCYFCLPNEIAITAKGRGIIAIYNSISLFGAVVMGLVISIVLLTNQVGLPEIFHPLMIIIGLSSAAALFITSFGIKENMFAQLQEHEPFIEGLKLTLKNKPFWIYMLPAFCLSLVFPILSTGIYYYIDYVIAGQDTTSFLIGLGLGVLLGLFVNLYLLDKIKTKKTIILSYYLTTLGFVLLFIIGQNASVAAFPSFPLGFGFVGLLLAGPVVMGDIIDNDELITGKRREGVYGGVNAIVTKPSLSIANWLFVSVIVFFGFISPIVNAQDVAIQQPQSEMAITGILIAFCIVPAIGLFISGILMHWYPLDGPEWLKKKKHIIELHEQKEKEYLQKLTLDGKQIQRKKKEK